MTLIQFGDCCATKRKCANDLADYCKPIVAKSVCQTVQQSYDKEDFDEYFEI
jgi:hypothetical protein